MAQKKKGPRAKRRKSAKASQERTRAEGRAISTALAKALAHELRLEILDVLIARVASPNELAKELGEGLSQVSYHVKVLKDYGCIELVKTEPRRGAVEHYYRATSRTLLPAAAWRALDPKVRAAVAGSTVSRVFDDAADALEAGKLQARDDQLHHARLLLDAEGQRKVKAITDRAAKEVTEEHNAAIRRRPRSLRKYTLGLLFFERGETSAEDVERLGEAEAASKNGKGARSSNAKGKKTRDRKAKVRKESRSGE
ncbi:MAG TPA: helix-turn-helix domain-containing protein [Solirubrobacterales bacterium]|nr:helix-turn-helix domain-containing protein [Solirubrobacterales bacterium]